MAERPLAETTVETLRDGTARTRRGIKITGPEGPVVAPRRKPVAAVGRLVAVAGLVGLG
jgi:hypothetical protein